MLTVVIALAIGSALPKPMCSVIPFATFRDPAVTHFTGTAAPDTVRAGAGRMGPSGQRGHWGKGAPREIFGQIIRVDRVAGADSARLEQAFSKLGAREVVVVPWAFSANCSVLGWGRSFRWVTTTAAGFYRAYARPESDWLDGRPVLDAVRAILEPYPHGVFFERGYRGTSAVRTGPALTPLEYLEFYSALPSIADAEDRPEWALAILDAWEKTHPDVAAKYPASATLSSNRFILERRIR